MPIDINLLRVSRGGNPDLVRQSQRNRYASVELVDEVIDLDDVHVLNVDYCRNGELRRSIDLLKKEKRQLSTLVFRQFRDSFEQIGKKRKNGEDSSEETQKVKEISDKIVEEEKELEVLRQQRDAKLRKIGNILSDTCIIDNNEVGLW